MAGSLETIKPLDLMQLFCGANKSGVLILIRENERGEIHLNKGEIYDAEVRGKDSLPPPEEAAVNAPTQELILAAAQRTDEAS
jgi:GTP cyclohydrolase II